jgi:integrase
MKRKPFRSEKRCSGKTVLRLPDLELAKSAVLNSLSCPDAQRGYRHAIDEFVDWYCSEPRLSFSKTVVVRYRMHLETRRLAPGTISLRLGAVRRLAYEASDLAAGIRRVKGVKKLGVRLGNWLTAEQGQALWQAPDRERLKGKCDRALLALLLVCGLRRHELAELTFGHLQQREGHWAIVDLRGKAGHVRTIPVPDWVYGLLNEWAKSARIDAGKFFRRVSSAGRALGRRCNGKASLARRKGVRRQDRHRQTRTPRSPSQLRSALPRRRRRTGADSIPSWPRLGPDHRTLPRLHSADFIGSERQDRNRARIICPRSFGRVADHSSRALISASSNTRVGTS